MYHLIKKTRRSDTGDFDLKNTVSSVVIDVNYSILAIPSDGKKLYSVEQQIEGRIACHLRKGFC